jgi:hypothetical protein
MLSHFSIVLSYFAKVLDHFVILSAILQILSTSLYNDYRGARGSIDRRVGRRQLTQGRAAPTHVHSSSHVGGDRMMVGWVSWLDRWV